MENATKALLIAAAVLIVIVIIALGVRLLNSSKDTSDQIDSTSESLSSKTAEITDSTTSSLQALSPDEVTRFNRQFEKYIGTDVSIDKVKELVDKIITNNKKGDRLVLLRFDESKSGGALTLAHNENQEKCVKLDEDIANLLKKEDRQKYKYTIRMTGECKSYTGGYKDGYIACMTIERQP